MSERKTYFFVFAILLFVACGKDSSNKKNPAASAQEDLSEGILNPINDPQFTSDTPAATAAQTFEVNVKLMNFTKEQEEKVRAAIDLIKKVVASDEFKKGVLNKTYKGKKTYVDNGGLSNSQIYKKILDGAEKVGNTKKNNAMDLELQVYYEDNTTIGYTYPNIKRIYMNRKYLNKFQPYQVADNLFHEWLHKIGFKHAVERTDSRAHSVPYSVGYLVKALARQMD